MYKFVEGARAPKGVTADQVAEALEEVREETGGEMTPRAIVEHAAPKSSPLHGFFEWRNNEAAQRYREWQARHVARVVVVESSRGDVTPVYVSTVRQTVDGRQVRVYDRPEVVVGRPDEWLYTLSDFSAKISGARRTLESLERFAGKRQDSDRLARIALAAKSLDAAIAALQ